MRSLGNEKESLGIGNPENKIKNQINKDGEGKLNSEESEATHHPSSPSRPGIQFLRGLCPLRHPG